MRNTYIMFIFISTQRQQTWELYDSAAKLEASEMEDNLRQTLETKMEQDIENQVQKLGCAFENITRGSALGHFSNIVESQLLKFSNFEIIFSVQKI